MLDDISCSWESGLFGQQTPWWDELPGKWDWPVERSKKIELIYNKNYNYNKLEILYLIYIHKIPQTQAFWSPTLNPSTVNMHL